ncbi:hypothetical protein V3C99_013750 [Haemonchus contortus]|nr:unnamed protein product [Haemonchus contortus]
MLSSSASDSLMIYMKNEVGVAIPIYVKTTDKVEKIYMEAAHTRAINRGSLRGKAFYHKGRRLYPEDVIGDVGIAFYDTVRLKAVEEPQSEKEINQQMEFYPLTNEHEAPIE